MAEVDTSIYRFTPKSVTDYQDEDARRQSNRLALLIQQGQYADQTQARDQRNRLYQALQGLGASATDEQRLGVLKANGAFDQADAVQKGILERQKTAAQIEKDNAAAEKDRIANAHSKIDRQLQMIAGVQNPDQYVQWLNGAVKEGVLNMQEASQSLNAVKANPAAFQSEVQRFSDMGLGIKGKLEQVWKQKGYDLDVERATETRRHNQTSEGLTARGQNMADARAREATTAITTKPFEVTGPDGSPMLVRQDRQGNITPVQGYGPKAGASKPLTEGQAKALGFGSRMREADRLLGDLEAKGVTTPSLIKQGAEAVPLIGGALGMAANATLASDDQQSVEQAQRDFVNAILRRESGAAISESEFQNARRQYFAQPGDSDQVRAQKARNRKLAMDGVLAEVPEGKRNSLSSTGGASGSFDISPDAIAAEMKRRGMK